jgi:hypothetical protein
LSDQAQPQFVDIVVGGNVCAFALDFHAKRWRAENADALRDLDEGDFPLVATVAGERFLLYSDGTFAREEL